MGADVSYDDVERSVSIKKDTKTIILYIDSDIAKVDGEDMRLDEKAGITSSRTVVPLRFVSETLGANVEWNGYEKTVDINTK